MEAFQQAAMFAEIQNCTFCNEIHDNGKKVLGYGNFYEGRILLIGEAPGKDEALEGVPFIGKAGQLLRKMIKEAGMDWNHIYITNTIKCRPTDNRNPEWKEIENCRGYLAAQIYGLQPAMIILIGRVAMEAVISTGMKITEAAGTFHKFYNNTHPSDICLFEHHVTKYGIDSSKPLLSIAMPILHPSYIDRQGGKNSNEYKGTVDKLRQVWKDYVEQKGWYSLLEDLPF